MKKRIFSLVLAVALLGSMAVAASAASVWKDGTHGGCSYSTVSSCYTRNWNCLIEWQTSSDSYTNYAFQVAVAPYESDGAGSYLILPYEYGSTSTRIASNNKNPGYTLYAIDVVYFVNGSQAEYFHVSAG